MPELEVTELSAAHSERSREPSAESSNSTSKEVSPKDAALLQSEVASLTKALSTVSNEAARIVTRQHWRKCLIGTEKDQSFLVRAMLKHSTPHVYERAIEDYGEKFLEAASDEFLDQALELRLPEIDADKLVALLAKAKRLGYDEEDVVDEEEDVIPAQTAPVEDSTSVILQAPNQPPHDVAIVGRSDFLLEEQNRNAKLAAAAAIVIASPMQASISPSSYAQNMNLPTRRKAKDPASRKFVCPDCTASFAQQGGLTYHMERKVCHRPAPQFRWFCKTCGKGFTTSGGKLYHEQNKVCEAHEIAKATPPPVQPQQGPVMIRPMPPPQLTDGRQAIAPYVSKPSSSHTSPSVGPPYLPAPYHTPYRSPNEYPRPPQYPPTQAPPSWPSQRVEPQSQTPVTSYTDLRASMGSPFQTPQARSSPTSDRTPGDSPSLDPATQAELNSKIATEVARFEKKCREIPDTLSAADRDEALNKEKRGHATRKSQIRKKYGIQIRTSKLQAANFVRVPGQGDGPILAPISRIAAFRAPPVSMTATYAISTPSSIEQSRQRPLMENPDPKRRKLEDSPSLEQEAKEQTFLDPQGVSNSTERRSSIQSPEILQVDENRKPENAPSTNPPPEPTKVPKKVQWDTPPHEATPPPPSPPPSAIEPSALRDISNMASTPHSQLPRSGKDLFVTTSDAGASNLEDLSKYYKDNKDDDDDDSDVDPDEGIPARLPAGLSSRRRTRSSAATIAASVSPSPKKSTGGIFPSASSSRRSSDSGLTATEKRGAGSSSGGLGGARVRAVVQV